MKLKELQDIVKIKWNKFYICKDITTYLNETDFDVTPEEFLKFAKTDYKDNSKKGLVGAVTNAKRAIDCQIDWIINYLGYEYLEFKEEKYPYLLNTINELEKEEYLNKDYPLKLRFIQALEIAPTFLISEIRTVRNKLEHEYILPSKEKARECIELAELFIDATQNKLFNRFITNYNIQNEYDRTDTYMRKPFYSISFEPGDGEIRIYANNEEDVTKEVRLSTLDEEYIYFIKSAISNNFYYLTKVFEVNIDYRYVNYEIEQF